MIKNIKLSGFKSFILEEIGLNKLTLLTGLNSSGKSSTIQAIRILSNVAKGEKNILLEGHGSAKELKSRYVEGGFTLTANLSNDSIVTYNSLLNSPEQNNEYPNIIYISADRHGPQTSIPMNNSLEIGSKGENILHCIHNFSDELVPEIVKHENAEGYTLIFNIRAWLSVISPNVKFDLSIQEKSDSSFSTFNEHRAMNVGFGLSYALPIITALLLGCIKKNSVVLLENPEAHLHPTGQTEMAKLIALCVQAGVQVVVETHSDHLFDGIRVFAKKNKGFASNVNTYWFELDKDNNSQVESATLDDNGRIDNWPTGMFDQFEINASELL